METFLRTNLYDLRDQFLDLVQSPASYLGDPTDVSLDHSATPWWSLRCHWSVVRSVDAPGTFRAKQVYHLTDERFPGYRDQVRLEAIFDHGLVIVLKLTVLNHGKQVGYDVRFTIPTSYPEFNRSEDVTSFREHDLRRLPVDEAHPDFIDVLVDAWPSFLTEIHRIRKEQGIAIRR